ncbi:hypothetical protein H2199_003257 [Coniosporium tulheliwenetii]|uniref:Uncharacterized protein n=1 Tax=Coniosporium tulheliwenetii TaxID=3383036 RepID=A0ACC2ZBR7_9PEZI|nr:hypothetical protein H2199_003257 [Cladosporium sp. JES 115]
MATASKTLNVQAMSPDHALYAPPKKSVSRLLKANPFVLGLACFASLGGFLFGYD